MADIIRFKRGTYDKIKDYTPDQGEPIYDKTRKSLRMGNGSDPINALPEIKGILENPADTDVLDAGIIGWDKTRNILKFGDGASNWIDLEQIKAVPEGFVNVKDFGAKGDGETDDTEAFNRALNFSKNIYIPAGTYKVSGLSLESCTVVGIFERTKIITSAPIIISGWRNYISNIVFEATDNTFNTIEIKGPITKLENIRVHRGLNGIYLDSTWDTILDNVYIYEFDEAGVNCSSAGKTSIHLRNVISYVGTIGIRLYNITYSTIISSAVEHVETGYYISSATQISLISCGAEIISKRLLETDAELTVIALRASGISGQDNEPIIYVKGANTTLISSRIDAISNENALNFKFLTSNVYVLNTNLNFGGQSGQGSYKEIVTNLVNT